MTIEVTFPSSASLPDSFQILARWAEHFEAVLNRPSQINDDAINRLPQVDVNEDLDTLPDMS